MTTTLAVSTGVTSGRGQDVWGTKNVSLFAVTCPSSYSSGGFAFDPVTYGHKGVVRHVLLQPRNAAAVVYIFLYDYTNKKILCYNSDAAPDEVSSIADSTDIDVIVIGD